MSNSWQSWGGGYTYTAKTPEQYADQAAVLAAGTAHILSQTNRLLGNDLEVRLEPPNAEFLADFPKGQGVDVAQEYGGLSSTDGSIVKINGRIAPLTEDLKLGWTDKGLTLVTGLNYQEVAHCEATARYGSELHEWVMRQGEGWDTSYRSLEDQRSEMHFYRKYKPSGKYFSQCVATFEATENNIPGLFPLVAGRTYMPAKVRAALKKEFALPAVADEFENICHEYAACVYPRDEAKMKSLITRYHELWEQVEQETQQEQPEKPSQHGTGEGGDELTLVNGQPGAQGEGEKSCSCTECGGTGKVDKPEPAWGQSQKGEKMDCPSCGGTGDSQNLNPHVQPGGNEQAKEGDRGSGASVGKWGKKTLDARDLVSQMSRDIGNDLRKELASKKAAIRGAASRYKVQKPSQNYYKKAVEPSEVTAARNIERVFRKMMDKFRPGWHLKKPTGKIDMNSLVRFKQGEMDIFKRWNEGVHNVMDYEVVICMDQSGSMGGRMHSASSSTWVLHKALKRIGAEVTVLGFSEPDEIELLMQRGISTPPEVPIFQHGGSTYVMPVFQEARRIFSASKRHLKLLVIVTDGGFSDDAEVRGILDRYPVPVAIIGIGAAVHTRWRPEEFHSLVLSQMIHQPSDLVNVVTNLVTSLAEARAEGRRR